ncbi:sigma-70 family RNA polymerase sigma factor [Roseivivax marinus]|uniref:sigma-70 family RNA polymerase sigma factor n=1 Tax=Roseivivax marinus TaxID=1379903 RepID=UPI00273F713E|nr:sigma-70 family RNA polymerase sigma factor [Roseivivax marinus]
MEHGGAEIDRLMRAGLTGDRAAYARCLRLLVPVMQAMARRSLPSGQVDLVEDIVQDALLALHLKRGGWDPERPLLPWVRVIVRHKAIDALRARRTEKEEALDAHYDICAPATDPLVGLHIEQALARLSTRDAALVRGHAIEGVDPELLSEQLGLSAGALRVALHRALRRLARAAKEDSEWIPKS